jgi:hypothetical protein
MLRNVCVVTGAYTNHAQKVIIPENTTLLFQSCFLKKYVNFSEAYHSNSKH